jgi:hypothetical protein
MAARNYAIEIKSLNMWSPCPGTKANTNLKRLFEVEASVTCKCANENEVNVAIVIEPLFVIVLPKEPIQAQF